MNENIDNSQVALNEPQTRRDYVEVINNGMDRCEGMLGQIGGIQSQMLAIGDTVNNIASLYTRCQEIKSHTAEVKAWSEVQMANTIAKYKVCQNFLESTFAERDTALQRHYSVLDDAISSGDREMILACLQNISNIVTKSPVEELEEFAKVFNNPDIPLLDF